MFALLTLLLALLTRRASVTSAFTHRKMFGSFARLVTPKKRKDMPALGAACPVQFRLLSSPQQPGRQKGSPTARLPRILDETKSAAQILRAHGRDAAIGTFGDIEHASTPRARARHCHLLRFMQTQKDGWQIKLSLLLCQPFSFFLPTSDEISRTVREFQSTENCTDAKIRLAK